MLARKKRKRGRTERRLEKRQAERNRSKTRRKEVLRGGAEVYGRMEEGRRGKGKNPSGEENRYVIFDEIAAVLGGLGIGTHRR